MMKYRELAAAILLILAVFATGVAAQDDHDPNHDDHGSEAGKSESTKPVDEHEGHDEGESEFVVLSDDEISEFGITLQTAGPGMIRHEIVVPGEVAVNGDRVAHIVPRFTGVVKQVLKRVGDQVREGDVLAIVESNEGLTPYKVISLMDGTVIEKQINVGEVHSGESPAFVVADLDTVWVNLSIYQMHLAEVRLGQTAAITADHGGSFATGEVSYVSPVVDEHTRTSTARVVLPNADGRWRPGLLIEGRIATASNSADVVVPKTAIFHMDDSEVVFVQTPEGFRARPVQLGRTNHSNAEVVSGLSAGEVYAASGGFTIKAEIQKGSFGDGHGH